MKNEILKKAALVLSSLLLTLIILEIILRAFIHPSEISYGTLFERELPPHKVIPTRSINNSERGLKNNILIVENRNISRSDLTSVTKRDPLLGYTAKENAKSPNGWWQSNNIGARASYDIAKEKPWGKKRMLVFGDSFANGSGVPQEDTWTYILNSEINELEVINFGLDGYSMGQSYLRYLKIKNSVDYDFLLLMFVPSDDLWREINTIRALAGWNSYTVMPRFIIKQGKLELIKSPYESGSMVYKKNRDNLSEELRSHLLSYDRFYFKSKYESPWIIGNSILYKLIAREYYIFKFNRLKNWGMNPNSEASRVTKKIFDTMNNDVKKDEKKFVLVILPTHDDISKLRFDSSFREKWYKQVSFHCSGIEICIDLSEDMLQQPQNLLDKGYDGTHYGPKANRLISELIRKHVINVLEF